MTGNSAAPALADSLPSLAESLLEEIKSITPRTYRLGGGRVEVDGSVSFVLRFLGSTESMAGELYIRQEEEAWLLDDLLLEEKRALAEIRDSYRYDFPPYGRFF